MWRLTVWNVPVEHNYILSNLGFRPTRRNPHNWSRVFNPCKPGEREKAVRIRACLLGLGLRGRWLKLASCAKAVGQYNFLTDLSVHNTSSGTWRLKSRPRK